jgi:hypothetical protein
MVCFPLLALEVPAEQMLLQAVMLDWNALTLYSAGQASLGLKLLRTLGLYFTPQTMLLAGNKALH